MGPDIYLKHALVDLGSARPDLRGSLYPIIRHVDESRSTYARNEIKDIVDDIDDVLERALSDLSDEIEGDRSDKSGASNSNDLLSDILSSSAMSSVFDRTVRAISEIIDRVSSKNPFDLRGFIRSIARSLERKYTKMFKRVISLFGRFSWGRFDLSRDVVREYAKAIFWSLVGLAAIYALPPVSAPTIVKIIRELDETDVDNALLHKTINMMLGG